MERAGTGDTSVSDAERMTELHEFPGRVFDLLQQAMDDNTAFRFPVLLTQSEAGPDGRTVVLRAVDAAARSLEFHTDVRAAKVAQIDASPHVQWVFYDASTRLQLRIRGEAVKLRDRDEIERRWRALSVHNRRAYAQSTTPGTPVASLAGAAPCPDADAEAGRANFSVFISSVHEIRWLQLDRGGHISVLMAARDAGWDTSWIMP